MEDGDRQTDRRTDTPDGSRAAAGTARRPIGGRGGGADPGRLVVPESCWGSSGTRPARHRGIQASRHPGQQVSRCPGIQTSSQPAWKMRGRCSAVKMGHSLWFSGSLLVPPLPRL
ncbi:hypothetical protein BO70DRAFT_7766 [Aspergillus heteromorphus CBS 117.55]|uniref:Uncharacterized protein n=1 Tax=Aspergillus heteromorphus CBS 117.55 TaxID=1448321 RepID=A0A317X6Y4_9EURO|nr:uncharacterized protein BO70DRAFT_7766 [Aspergillus heteromorphus CBS 117.55]PWY92350.1 hypothetical protein BO70DRAFT_7766 [Aspergillus heteromorphus CBS 117.55]